MNYMHEQTKDLGGDVKLQITSIADKTNWLNVREDTLEVIKQALVEQEEKEKAGYYD
jgi:hypothetical protein